MYIRYKENMAKFIHMSNYAGGLTLRSMNCLWLTGVFLNLHVYSYEWCDRQVQELLDRKVLYTDENLENQEHPTTLEITNGMWDP